MRSLQILKPALVSLVLALGIPFSTQVQAHGGLSLADDVCKLTIGPYTMHFTGYQPDNTQEKEFCEDIPLVGRTVVALDYIEEELRPMPTEVRVIRDTGAAEVSGADLDAVTIFHLPAKVYPNGSINFEYKFDAPGKFVGLVTIGEKGEHVSRFPFSVGQPKTNWSTIIVGIAAVIGAGAFFFMRGRKSADTPVA